MLLAVTGMRSEAKLLANKGARVVVAGSNAAAFREQIDRRVREGVSGIISLGVAGGLSPDWPVGKVLIARSVGLETGGIETDSNWTNALSKMLPHASTGTVLGVRMPVMTAQHKSVLYKETGADAVDMESDIAAQVARNHSLPFAVLRAISDDAENALPPAAAFALNENGSVNYSAVMLSLLDEPSQFRALVRTAWDTSTAMKALRRSIQHLGRGLGCPYVS